ncbi:flagellar hook-length control protein FliK [Armatimonas sp.]|uniref:flagellar hook-length control protein FliK n=1 Tax=Armatimonas sp. TaxID=1872638 RepID=UPI00374CE1CE
MPESRAVSESRGTTPTESSVRTDATGPETTVPSDFQATLQQLDSEQEAMQLILEQSVLDQSALDQSVPVLPTTALEMQKPDGEKKPEPEQADDATLVPDPSVVPAFFAPSAPSPPLPSSTPDPSSAESLSVLPMIAEPLPGAKYEQSEAALPKEMRDALAALTPIETTEIATEILESEAVVAPAKVTAPAASPAPQVGTETPTAPIRLPELPQQLVPIVRRLNDAGNQELRVRLDPPHLGELSVVLESGQDGISIRIVAQTRETLLLLQDQRGALQEELSRQNLSIASFTASLAGDTSGQRSHARFFDAPVTRSVSGGMDSSAEQQPLIVRLPLHSGGLDAHA